MNSQQDDFAPAIDRLLADIRKREDEIAERKRMVNALCEMAERSPMFHDVEAERISISAIKGDQFFGKPLQAAIRGYLLMRGDSSKGGMGAATVNEIYDALVSGGYEFDAKDALNAKRGLRISLTKNSATFSRLRNGRYGLLVWYPTAKGQRAEARKDDSEAVEPSPEDNTHELEDGPGDEQAADDENEPHTSAA